MAVSLAYLFHQLFNFDDAPCRSGHAGPVEPLSPDWAAMAARLGGSAERNADIPSWPPAATPWWTRCVVLDQEAAAADLPAPSTPDWFVEAPAAAPSLPAVAPADEDEDGRAAVRAAALIDELDIPRRQDRDAALHWLIELLREFPHGSSHRAIAGLIHEGCSFEELQTTAAVKRMWRHDSGLWLVRRYDRHERRWIVKTAARHGHHALTWRDARRLAAFGEAEEVTALLRTMWRDAWLALAPYQPGYLAFIDLIRWRMDRRSDNSLTEGLAELEHANDPHELADEFRWFERLGRPLRDALGERCRPRTPFEPSYLPSSMPYRCKNQNGRTA